MSSATPRTLVIAPAWNEAGRIGAVVRGACERAGADAVLVVDDGSTDATASEAASGGALVERHAARRGVGAALRTGFGIARARGFDVAVVIAGNGKDDPADVPRLVAPLASDRADLTIGSRYAPGGSASGGMPLHRRFATRLHPLLLAAVTGRHLTESTSGFRAIRTRLLDDPRIALDQRWLDGYALEPYQLLMSLRLGHRVHEVPVTKTYPPAGQRYTRMRGPPDWWQLLSPLLLVPLRLRH